LAVCGDEPECWCFVGGDNVVIGSPWGTLPNAFVQTEDGAGFLGKARITREDPASMLPATKGIAAEPAPQRGAADLRDRAL